MQFMEYSKLKTLNATIPRNSSDTIRHHKLYIPTGFHIACPHVPRLRRCAWPLNVTHPNLMLPAGWWRGRTSLQLCLDDRASQFSLKAIWDIVKLPSKQNWSLFLFDQITGHGHSDSKFYTLVRWHSTASAPLIPSGSWSAQLDVSSLRPGRPLCKGSQVTRSRDIVKIVYV